jgi:hypothetical protein
MTEEKKPKKRRPDHEIAAEKKAWLLRHDWAGAKKALGIVKNCKAALEEATDAAGTADAPWDGAQLALSAIETRLTAQIPREAM